MSWIVLGSSQGLDLRTKTAPVNTLTTQSALRFARHASSQKDVKTSGVSKASIFDGQLTFLWESQVCCAP